MTVYADVLLVVNLYVDYILLHCVRRFLGLSTSNFRLVLGALTGGALSLLGLLPLPGWTGPFLAGACALGTAAAAFAPAKGRLLLRCWLSLWTFSFLLCGFLLFVSQFAPPGYLRVVGGAVYLNLSLPLLFLCTCGAYLVFRAAGCLLPRTSSPLPAKIRIEHNGRSCTVTAKADTGNALREPFSGLPVIVCAREELSQLSLETEAAPLPPGMRLVPFSSLGGKGVLPAFRPDRVVLLGRTDQPLSCYIALADTSFSRFSALFNPELFPELAAEPPV